MIKSFKHKGLATFFATGSIAGIQAKHAKRLRLILGRLNAADKAQDMNLAGLRLHSLSGNRAGFGLSLLMAIGVLHFVLNVDMLRWLIMKIIIK